MYSFVLILFNTLYMYNVIILKIYISCIIRVGGDQMTSARLTGCQRIRHNSERGKDKLKGIVPVPEDWHTKQCFVQV